MNDDFEMLDDDDFKDVSSKNNVENNNYGTPVYTNSNRDQFIQQDNQYINPDGSRLVYSSSNRNQVENYGTPVYSTSNREQVNNNVDNTLAYMYDDEKSESYEEALKTATPEVNKEKNPVETKVEVPKEVTYSDDFMDYDPMLHNDLQTDGDYVISPYDPNNKSDYIPEKTEFDSEGMMEYNADENVEKEKVQENVEEPEVPETYNTAGMMQYDTNNVDTFNDGKTPTETVVTRFIFDDMKNSSEDMPSDLDKKQEINIGQNSNSDNLTNQNLSTNVDFDTGRGAIPIYNRQDEIDANIKKQNSSRKTYEMVGMIIFFALLILLISFFPDINKIFDNFKK